MFCCESCSYKSNRKTNLKRHIISKHKRDAYDKELTDIKNLQMLTSDLQMLTSNPQMLTKNPQMLTQNLQMLTQHKNDFFCPGCQKVFKSSYNLKIHQNVCKGVSNNLECHHCHKVFTKAAAKSRHLKICKMKEVRELVAIQLKTQNITNNTQNNLHNNTMNNITVNYNTFRAPYHPHEYYDKDEYYNIENINDFGKEDISYIPDEEMMHIALNYDIKGLITQKHFNPSHPENHNIRTNCNKSYKILKDKTWTVETKDAVYSIIYSNSQCKIQDYAHTHLINKLLDSEKTEEYLDRMSKINEKPKIKRMNNFIDIKIKERNQNILNSNIKNRTIGATNVVNGINEPIMITV
jgi:dsDNA-binding SOS-regulon protein